MIFDGGMLKGLVESEELQGGVVSPNLVRGRLRGYALYVTNKRVVGEKRPNAGLGFLIGAGMAGPVGGLIGHKMTDDENLKAVRELDERKDFEMRKEDIARIELRKPGTLVGGHVIFIPRTGEPVKVKIGTRKDFEITINLMRKFLPEAVSSV
jgi:hypothetical protein